MTEKNRSTNQIKRFGGTKVLLAEGSLIDAVHVECILKRWNLKIDIVRSGNEAVEKVRDMRYDILLLGIQIAEWMP
jgi:DNA-binding response OmpR family regulator